MIRYLVVLFDYIFKFSVLGKEKNDYWYPNTLQYISKFDNLMYYLVDYHYSIVYILSYIMLKCITQCDWTLLNS